MAYYRDGLNGVADSWSQRLSRVEQALRDEGLAWPAELVADLAHQFEMYRRHDARFEPRQVVQLLGELTARERAIVNETRAVPQALIRGTKADRPAEIAGGRMIGIAFSGPAESIRRSHYLQDVDSGGVVAVERTFAEPRAEESPRWFRVPAPPASSRGVSLATLASSQLLLKSGKRTPGGLLLLPRTAASLATHPQSYQWEQLERPPLRSRGLRPARRAVRRSPLRASARDDVRRTSMSSPWERADMVAFDPTMQRLTARLLDPQGGFATLVHPFHHRGREGFNDLASILDTPGAIGSASSPAMCRTPRSGVDVQPIAIVLDDGRRRLGVQPWLPLSTDIATSRTARRCLPDRANRGAFAGGGIHAPRRRPALRAVADRPHPGTGIGVDRVGRVARQVGFARLTAPIAALANALLARANTVRWDATPALHWPGTLPPLSTRLGMR